ncbi:hypothetical protein KCU64_g16900, partial [Aureobasidium melanogenum]
MHWFTIFLTLVGLVMQTASCSVVPATREEHPNPKVMVFDCNKVGEVCDNMCFGAQCAGWGRSFTWDKPSKQTSSRRSTLAGCGSGNRCKDHPYGDEYQCDEYPFKSVLEAKAGGQVNRCVPWRENNAQSQTIKNFYYSLGKDFKDNKGKGCNKKSPCAFQVGFKNAGNVQYCNVNPDCRNDGNEYTKAGLFKTKRSITTGGGYYELENGDVIFSPVSLGEGSVAYMTVPRNTTLYDEHNMNHVPDPDQDDSQYDYMMDNLDLVELAIVKEVDGHK